MNRKRINPRFEWRKQFNENPTLTINHGSLSCEPQLTSITHYDVTLRAVQLRYNSCGCMTSL